MVGLVVRPVETLRDEQLAQVQVIYARAFAAELRVPFAELTQTGPPDLMLVAMDGDAPAGFAALRLLGSVQWSFLRYFVIADERRSQGLGREFWQLLQQSLRELTWPADVVFEVEDPDDAAGDPGERLIRERRIRFWTACGARVLAVRQYVLPDYTASGLTEPMLLMAVTPGAPPTVLLGHQLRDLVLAIYRDRYGLASDHPLAAQAVASIAT